MIPPPPLVRTTAAGVLRCAGNCYTSVFALLMRARPRHGRRRDGRARKQGRKSVKVGVEGEG